MWQLFSLSVSSYVIDVAVVVANEYCCGVASTRRWIVVMSFTNSRNFHTRSGCDWRGYGNSLPIGQPYQNVASHCLHSSHHCYKIHVFIYFRPSFITSSFVENRTRKHSRCLCRIEMTISYVQFEWSLVRMAAFDVWEEFLIWLNTFIRCEIVPMHLQAIHIRLQHGVRYRLKNSMSKFGDISSGFRNHPPALSDTLQPE